MIRALVLAGLVLGAAPVLAQNDDPVPDPQEQAACTAAGGSYGQFGLFRGFLCLRPTPDAGQACNKAGDCTGLCLAETRSCSAVTPLFGCHAILTETGDEVVICID